MKYGKGQYHSDGTKCCYGKQQVPKKFKPCCDGFRQCTLNCEYDIRFVWNKGWGIVIPADGSCYTLNYCPFCGKELK